LVADYSGLRAAIQNGDPATRFTLVLTTAEFGDEQAVVNVILPAAGETPAARQTRFYRRTSSGWQQTAPDAALWGSERSLETPSLIFHFRHHDAPTIIAVAPQLEALATTLRRNWGLPMTPDAKRWLIDVRVTETPGHTALWFGAPERIVVPSPAVYWAPLELTDAALLVQSIALPLLDDLLAQAGDYHRVSSPWQPMLRGLRLWQVWDLDLPLAAWRKETVQWLYLDLPADGPEQPILLPSRYTEICAAHKLWMPSPLQIDIPLMCAEREREYEYFSLRGQREPLTRLDQLAVPVRPDSDLSESSRVDRVYPHGQVVALVTLIEYAVAAYGRERLPALVAGLGQYDRWETLVPAVFGVSAAEFEAGWQRYLAARSSVPVESN
jgi:hypothetical protein